MTADTQAQGDLPELPKGRTFVDVFYSSMPDGSDDWYTADQMREYGRACVAAALQGRGTQEGEPSEAEAIVAYCRNYPNATFRDAMSAYRAALAQAQKEQT